MVQLIMSKGAALLPKVFTRRTSDVEPFTLLPMMAEFISLAERKSSITITLFAERLFVNRQRSISRVS